MGGDDKKESGTFADFADELDGLEPLEPGRRVRPHSPTPPAPQPSQANAASPLHFPDPDEPLLARHSSVRHRTLVRLRRGEIPQRVRIDLHGETLETAKQRVRDELLAATGPGEACALIIHGKGHHSPEGTARLKAALPQWLCDSALESRVRGGAPGPPSPETEGAGPSTSC